MVIPKRSCIFSPRSPSACLTTSHFSSHTNPRRRARHEANTVSICLMMYFGRDIMFFSIYIYPLLNKLGQTLSLNIGENDL